MLVRGIRNQNIWVYSEPIDFRKQINGLVNIIVDDLEKEPDNGSIYVFRNRTKKQLKLLYWDRNGYVMGVKRLERGRFDFPRESSGNIRITPYEWEALLSGMPILEYRSKKKGVLSLLK